MKLNVLVWSAIPLLWTSGGIDSRSPGANESASLRRELTVDVDLSAARLVIRVDGREVGSYDVAVGKPAHRTPTGTYKLSRVVWNPSWTPPDAAWADTAVPKEPGERGNPMGRVKIMFDGQLYIHGTPNKASLGEPVSHGCIRMSNDAAIRLARLVMEHGGASRPERWYTSVLDQPTESFEVAIPTPPVLRIRQ